MVVYMRETSMKLLFCDTETGGLDPKTNPLLQVSLIVDITGKDPQEFDLRLRPHSAAVIDPKALQINNLDPERLHDPDRLTHDEAYRKLKSIFLTYIDRYDRADKFYLVGQNVHFDYGFLLELWNRNGDGYLGSFVHYHKIDLIALTAALRLVGKLPTDGRLPSMKLEALCSYFQMPKQTHDSMSDIRQTREIFGKYLRFLEANPHTL
jgi:DNA polymerase-3 subunit epsilon